MASQLLPRWRAGAVLSAGLLAVHVGSPWWARPTAASGAIDGRIAFSGTPPPPTIVIEDGRAQQVLYVDHSGGLQFVVVVMTDVTTSSPPPPATEAVVNQRGYVFEPQVLAVRAGQPVRFTNDDPANHNVRTRSGRAADTFSVNTGMGERVAHRFGPTSPDDPVELSCDIHPWMEAWIYAFDHAYFAVTDPAGRFRISAAPVGRHHLAIRQPAGGLARDVVIDVRADEVARVDVTFTAADLHRDPGSAPQRR
jgi:plastocyanin